MEQKETDQNKPEKQPKNTHYSELTGHNLRSVHANIVKKLGVPPETVPGFDGLTSHKEQLIRRRMRRITWNGK